MIAQIIPKAGYIDIRDRVLAILASEIPAQLALAISEGDTDYQAMLETFYDVNDELNIFSERAEPFDVQELNAINVYLTNINEEEGSNSRLQKGKCSINIDITVGSDIGYSDSANRMHWMASTIRGILSSGEYHILGLTAPSIIRRRWVTGVSLFQPNETDNTSYLSGGTVGLVVEYDENNIIKATENLLGNDSFITANNGKFKLINDLT